MNRTDPFVTATFPVSQHQDPNPAPAERPLEAPPLPLTPFLSGAAAPVNVQYNGLAPTDPKASQELHLSLISGENRSSLKPGEKDKEVLEKKAKVQQLIFDKIKELQGTTPSFRTYSGRDRGEIVVVIKYIDVNGAPQVLPDNPDNLEIKETIRELHRLILGPPAQSHPFERVYIPGFKNDPLYFFQKDGHFDRMWKFVQSQQPPIPREDMFARIYATRKWIDTALITMRPIIEKEQKEIKKPDHLSSPAAARKDRESKLQELERIYSAFYRLTQDTKESTAELLILNWAVALNEQLGGDDLTRAKQVEQGLQQILETEDAIIAERSAFSLRNPFGKVGPGSLPLEQRREWSHSASALTLYRDDEIYREWCDHAGRNMKADCILRLITTNVFHALDPDSEGPDLHFSGAPLNNPAFTMIFKKAALAAKTANRKALEIAQQKPSAEPLEWYRSLLPTPSAGHSTTAPSKNPGPRTPPTPTSDTESDSDLSE